MPNGPWCPYPGTFGSQIRAGHPSVEFYCADYVNKACRLDRAEPDINRLAAD
jgi:hypothetical protein